MKGLSIEAEQADEDYEVVAEEGDDLLGLKTLHIDTTVTIHNMSPGREKPTRKRASKVQSKRLSDKASGRKKFWTLKFKGKMHVSKGTHLACRSTADLRTGARKGEDKCACTGISYRRSDGDLDINLTTARQEQDANQINADNSSVTNLLDARVPVGAILPRTCLRQGGGGLVPIVNMDELYPTNDIDEERIIQRRREMEQGIDVENVWVHRQDQSSAETSAPNQIASTSKVEGASLGQYPSYGAMGLLSDVEPCLEVTSSLACSTSSLTCPWVLHSNQPQQIHTQVDYIHYLVPGLDKIVSSSYYWGVMDRYQAEKLIENKPEGTFLLRDSAQDEFLFSVSFRRYGRSLHARIEQWNHSFSFDSRDPGVYATKSVCGLIDHYKDPSCCMFFEPMLTLPLPRTFPFSLQHLARATICSRTTYDGISQLSLPRSLKEYLQVYHYKQKVRVRRFDNTA